MVRYFLMTYMLGFVFWVQSQTIMPNVTQLPLGWESDFSFVVMDRDYYVAAFGNLKNGIPHGKWIYFDTLGNASVSGRYKNGLRQGEWVRYDYVGDRVSRGLYKKGKLHGKWEFYDQVWIFKDGVRYE